MPKLMSNLFGAYQKANEVVNSVTLHKISSYDGTSGITPESTVVKASMGGSTSSE